MKIFKSKIIAGLFICLVVVFLLAPFASSHPDGLERAAAQSGIVENEKAVLPAFMKGYAVPGIKNEKIATAVAGASGVLITFGVFYLIGKLISKPSIKSGK